LVDRIRIIVFVIMKFN